jgi:biotin operon repressor
MTKVSHTDFCTCIKRMAEQNKSLEDVAKELGLTLNAVQDKRQYLKDKGIKFPKIKVRRTSHDIVNVEELNKILGAK